MQHLLPIYLFYVFAAITVLSALMVITQNNPVRCVLFLVVAFFASAILWLLVQAEFLALILVLVYVGAVMTLFLFVVMMLNIDIESMRGHFARYLPFGLIVIALLVGLLMVALPKGMFDAEQVPAAKLNHVIELTESSTGTVEQSSLTALSNTEEIGMVLYTDYVFAFELAAVLLLVAIVAAITLAHRQAIRSKRQSILKQLMTRPEERVKLVSMPSENK